MKAKFLLFTISAFFILACNNAPEQSTAEATAETNEPSEMDQNLAKYVPVKLTTDVEALSDKQKEMVKILIEAGKIMDGLFWQEAYGDPDEILNKIEDEKTKQFVKINYGPWDRLANNTPFVAGVAAKPSRC